MKTRPADESGDILPVLSPKDLHTGPQAAAEALRDHLKLYAGDWWEYASKGNEIQELLADSRRRERDAAALVTYLTSYILSLKGIVSVSGASGSFSGRAFHFSCTAHTEENDAASVTLDF